VGREIIPNPSPNSPEEQENRARKKISEAESDRKGKETMVKIIQDLISE